MSYRDIKSSENLFSRTNRNDRFKQMTKQQQLIEEKKRQIQEKLELQKRKLAEELNTKPDSTVDKKPLIFSNDGSFLDQFKKLSGKAGSQDVNLNGIQQENNSEENKKDEPPPDLSSKPEENTVNVKGDDSVPQQQIPQAQPPPPPPPIPPNPQRQASMQQHYYPPYNPYHPPVPVQPPSSHLHPQMHHPPAPPPTQHFMPPYGVPPPPPPPPVMPPMMPQNIPPPLLPQAIPPPQPLNVQNIPPPLSIPPPPLPPCYPPPSQFNVSPTCPRMPNLMVPPPPPNYSNSQVPAENVQGNPVAGDRYSPLHDTPDTKEEPRQWFSPPHKNNYDPPEPMENEKRDRNVNSDRYSPRVADLDESHDEGNVSSAESEPEYDYPHDSRQDYSPRSRDQQHSPDNNSNSNLPPLEQENKPLDVSDHSTDGSRPASDFQLGESSNGNGILPQRVSLGEQTNNNGSAREERESEQSSRKPGERKRKSRWGDEKEVVMPPAVVEVVPNVPKISVAGMSGHMLSKVTRTEPGLLQYAKTAYGSANLSEEDWKKAEENYKVHLLFQDMMAKRAALEKLREAGKQKYEYDSDEEIDEKGTWEHKLREKEMVATQEWAESLTEMAKGKHHIGDFLPPDELKKFLAKYNAVKGGGEPDLSDYKEYKLGEDNKGFQMLQKLGWSEGMGLGSDGAGRLDPINKGQLREFNEGLGHARPDDISNGDDEYDAYRKRMMLAYRFRPNPLNNPRRPYY